MIICHAHSAGAAIRLALSLSMPITSGAVLNADIAEEVGLMFEWRRFTT